MLLLLLACLKFELGLNFEIFVIVVVRGVVCLICLSRLQQAKKKEIFNQIRFESEDKKIKKKVKKK